MCQLLGGGVGNSWYTVGTPLLLRYYLVGTGLVRSTDTVRTEYGPGTGHVRAGMVPVQNR
jgi:hypothetical protein